MAMRYIPIFILLFLSSSCKSDDQLTHTKPLTLGDTLISNGGGFALGFFSPSSSNTSLYLGIWYHNIPGPITIVWVANRDNPILAPSSPVLAITNSSDLVLSDSQGRTPWAVKKNSTGAGATAVLLDEGNLVLRLPNGKITWQSFDHPTDTVLPKMRFLVSYKAKVAMRLVAWKGPDDPSSGDFSCSGDPSSPDLQFVTWNKTEPYCRLTVRSGKSVSGGTYLTNTSSVLYQTSVNSGDEFYVTYTISDNSTLMRLMIDYTGKLKYLSWNRHTSSWAIFGEHPYVPCELYASCGPFSYCDFTQITPACQCLDGFEPDDGVNFFSKGCYRQEALKCGKQSHFAPLSGMKVPDNFFHIRNRSLDECAAECSRNCSCTAYAYSDLSSAGAMADPSRCLVWSGELIDAGKSTSGENMYIRLANSPVNKKPTTEQILLPIIAFLLLLACIALVGIYKYKAGKWRKKKNQKKLMLGYFSTSKELEGNSTVPSVTFEDILSATNFFADSNLLGRGGFGKVYKGTFEGENVVAVKRLSQNSGQGTVEFRNEVVLIAKLQHKNLVRLLGCCIHGDEKLLIYEYLPNKSLDSYLFDFGMARIFGANQNQANTNRVVGTYGYMSPEYAMRGAFSVKSDTYSFGVLLLEIVSGLKISSPQLIANFSSLITYAWRLWEDEKATELVDCSVVASCPLHEVLRCIHVGLLCVQDHPNDRPLMSSVMNMIENENALLPTPKQPIYFAESNYEGAEARESMENSVNEMSITTLEGR
ncbi:G-type lectin S-receptor-like serine/threonine-protein kinase B120 isoform X8 [Lolium rigidum]|uniref:G-type lectin S-receptor-like serine/threonine-protein kinase B120 isoform X8 n=1 Tax=Lolium rigidum TaxID=89674 RepID=UPI001F5C6720|nr:G-type lectin S-receptor-like serine/threonine-protein kinase B120 isoform X8 [Lolium rigidum]